MEIEETIQTFTEGLNRVQFVENLPQDMDPPRLISVHCAALNLFSAMLRYLHIAVCHFQSSFQSNHIIDVR